MQHLALCSIHSPSKRFQNTWKARSRGHRQGEDCLPASEEMIEEHARLTGGVRWHVDGLQATLTETFDANDMDYRDLCQSSNHQGTEDS